MDSLKLWGRSIQYQWICLSFGLFVACVPLSSGQAQDIPVRGPSGVVWEAHLDRPEAETAYFSEVAALLEVYEQATGVALTPGSRGNVGIKVNTRGGRGLSTPLGLLRAVVEELVGRGFERQFILIVDQSTYGLREAGILPALSAGFFSFEGCPVYALDREIYYDDDWFYDSPLPPSRNQDSQFFGIVGDEAAFLSEGARARKSFLPMPLLFEVDFWINLAVGANDKALGIDGALASATLWNVSNSERFLSSEATASAAIAEIAAIPELSERMCLHFVSLARYQYVGGPQFNSLYTYSEPLLWMSADPVAIDRLLFERINVLRRNNGFPEIASLPRQLPFAASLGLGTFEVSRIELRRIAVEPRLRD